MSDANLMRALKALKADPTMLPEEERRALGWALLEGEAYQAHFLSASVVFGSLEERDAWIAMVMDYLPPDEDARASAEEALLSLPDAPTPIGGDATSALRHARAMGFHIGWVLCESCEAWIDPEGPIGSFAYSTEDGIYVCADCCNWDYTEEVEQELSTEEATAIAAVGWDGVVYYDGSLISEGSEVSVSIPEDSEGQVMFAYFSPPCLVPLDTVEIPDGVQVHDVGGGRLAVSLDPGAHVDKKAIEELLHKLRTGEL